MDSFANRLKQALEMRDMKPAELASKTGISRSDISNYLAGRYKAKQDKLYPISVALDVLPEWLMGCDVPMSPSHVLPIPPSQSSSTLTEDEQRLLMAYRNASDDLRLAAIAMLESFQCACKKSPAESTGT